ncbi:hypothetical protein [Alienimonas sp. DA493]|uniref:hypothetical protein n=1 Tax=Alienimonas sp. DA493 TaxID=3373605 RepID=UPI003753EF11
MPFTDILNCGEPELWDVLDSEAAYAKDLWFQAKGIGMIELCKLGEALGVASYEELFDGFDLIGDPRDDGPWPQTIPESLTKRIGNLTDGEIAAVLPEWADVEEFGGTVTEDSLADYLKRLRKWLDGRDGPFFLINSL